MTTTRRIAGYALTLLALAAFLAIFIFAGGKAHPLPPRPAHTIITSPAAKTIITAPKVDRVIPSPAPKVTKATVIHHRATRPAPSAADRAELATARRESGMPCHLEYDGPGAGYEVICTPPRPCAKVGDALMRDCIRLYDRKPETRKNADGSIISNPAGPALVRECTSQYTDYAELHACLTQPHI